MPRAALLVTKTLTLLEEKREKKQTTKQGQTNKQTTSPNTKDHREKKKQ